MNVAPKHVVEGIDPTQGIVLVEVPMEVVGDLVEATVEVIGDPVEATEVVGV